MVSARMASLDVLALALRTGATWKETPIMDMRTGDLYPSLDAARQAGVPEEHLAEVEAEIVRVVSGPFKGRAYERHPQSRQLRRRKDLEKEA